MSFSAGRGSQLRTAVEVLAALSVLSFCAASAIISLLFYVSPGGDPPAPFTGRAAVRPSAFASPAFFSSGSAGVMALRKNRDPFIPFGEYLVFTSSGPVPEPYNIQLSLPTDSEVEEGDLLAVRFYIRRPFFSAPARADFVFEQAGGEYKKSIVLPAEAGARWRLVETSFRSAGAYPAGKAHANFRLGFGAQTVELAGFELANYGGTAPAPSFLSAGYEGREPGAAWRAEALERIERSRKGDIKVVVADALGRPVAGAKVSVRQLRHSFLFGGAINSTFLNSGERDKDRAGYRKLFLTLFNSATIENDMKWYYWSGESKVSADRTAAWLKANMISLRGHTLVWPGWEHMPQGMEKMKGEPEKLRAAVRAHVREEASYYRGRVSDWDVLNEPLDNSEALSMLGPAEPAMWFKLARRADPAAKLYVNESGILSDLGANAARQAAYQKFISSLLQNGAPLDGIGLQCHFGLDLTPPERLITILDRFQKLGKPLYATELDIEVPDEKLQADYLRDFMIAMFSHPAVRGITLWSLWEGVHSEPLTALYAKDWRKKPAAAALEDLLLKQWHTELSGLTAGNGEFKGRGFYGDYEITVSAGQSVKKTEAVLSKDTGTVTIILDGTNYHGDTENTEDTDKK